LVLALELASGVAVELVALLGVLLWEALAEVSGVVAAP